MSQGKRLVSPFGADRLRELMWVEGMTQKEIGEYAACLFNWEKAPAQTTVGRWFRDAEVPVRSRNFLTPARRVQVMAALETANESPLKRFKVVANNRTRPVKLKQKFSRSGVRARRKNAKSVEIECALPGCKIMVLRTPSQIARTKHHTYCCKEHKARGQKFFQVYHECHSSQQAEAQ